MLLHGKYVNKYYLRFALFFIIGILALVAVDIVQLKLPELLGEVVDLLEDGVINEAVKKSVTSIALEILAVCGVMFIGRVSWRISLFYASHKIEADIRHNMFLKSEQLSRKYFYENKVGTIMNWFTTDIEEIETYFGWGTLMLVDAIFMSILVVIKMLKLDWVMSIICFIPAILLIVWGFFVEKYMDLKWKQRQGAFDKLYDFSQENFTGIRVIKAFVKETKEIHHFAKVAKNNMDVNISFARLSVIFDVIIEIILGTVFALLLGLGGWFTYSYISGNQITIFNYSINMSASKLVTFTGYFDSLIWPTIALGQVLMMKSRASASLKRISGFLDATIDVKNPLNPITLKDIKGNITFKNFTFYYPNSKVPHLKNISLEIKSGETIGIVGRIGCGKTTLCNILLRLFNVSKNAVFIDDIDIMDAELSSLRENIAFVPQDNFLFSDSIKRNIAFFDVNTAMEEVEQAAVFADVDNNIKDFDKGYETVCGERGVTLSGGQKQRVSIARAYIKKAPIMILDDSVSAVDVKTEETILHNIIEQRKGLTTIVAASRVSTVSSLDKIIVLNNGELEAFDTPENLLKTSKTYQTMVYLQQLEKEVEGGN